MPLLIVSAECNVRNCMQIKHLDASVNSSDKNHSKSDLFKSAFPIQLNTLAKKQSYCTILYLLGNREPDGLDKQKKAEVVGGYCFASFF